MTLEVEEVAALLKAASEDKYEALWVLALTTALRPEEYLGLRWRDVDLERQRLTVAVTLETKGPRILKDTKTEQSNRTIRLTTRAVAALRAHRDRQTFLREAAGSAWSDLHGLVFTTSVGTPLQWTNVSRRSFVPWLERAGVRRIRPYDLRHTGASVLLAMGVPVNEVSEYLGHADPNVTLSTYAHVLKGKRDRAVQVMEEVFGG